MKKFLSPFTLFLIFMMGPLFALQNDSKKPSWKILEQAQFCFDSGNYGEALRLSNLALNMHKNEIDSEYNILDIAVSPAQVKHAGDEFVNVLSVLEERESKEAISIINKYLALHGKIFFNDDIKIMLDWLKKKNVYPEADFLVGKIYQIEGEYDTAYKFYTKALDEGDYLDIPDEIDLDDFYRRYKNRDREFCDRPKFKNYKRVLPIDFNDDYDINNNARNLMNNYIQGQAEFFSNNVKDYKIPSVIEINDLKGLDRDDLKETIGTLLKNISNLNDEGESKKHYESLKKLADLKNLKNI